ncbi:hypothetical protein FSP39_007907 [Pinctada imbricata]|uniref:Mannosylglycerate hydrolase MGH1-like glycoside hydrolase domain-containing protein n=1 Tax=Pinctada imbricata TaxID=66713 RepID=A0AA88XW00_PINIB|nr:hypothetical protein FSP39_007907 [Pinctada imbricata]
MLTGERKRLREDKLRAKNWKRWGPYLSERQWGTVREDYSDDGNCWNYFSHDDSRSRAYRWGEDGLMGICDREGRLCMGLALWNGKDPILKERLFGLTGHQGNHGEDVKELYYYLDSTPTHSYMKALYKYPQQAYPYSKLVEENGRRGVWEPEYEIEDTGVFDEGYFDVKAEYCKNSPNDILCRYTISNRGDNQAQVHVLPSLWFRNVWSWGTETHCYVDPKPSIEKVSAKKVACHHPTLGVNQGRQRVTSLGVPIPFNEIFEEPSGSPSTCPFYWEVDVDPDGQDPELLFTENNTNYKRLYNTDNSTPYVKDAFHNYVIHDKKEAVNPEHRGTKCAAHYILNLKPKQEVILRVRLYYEKEAPPSAFQEFDSVFKNRIKEADDYYDFVIPNKAKEERRVARQAYAGLLWSKQFYYYVVKEWLHGDPGHPPPPRSRLNGRNKEWIHLFNNDIVSMPDKWEYPWYASWDLAFHMISMADVDLQFAKDQLILLMREWYMHPNGQIPAYEFSFEDVNPPVHAYAALKVYKASGPKGERDICFLARCFHKLILNFTWWINRKDVDGKNIFSGGFLGLDNIGVFDRSKPLPTGGSLAQADATAWMAFFCAIMLEISLILARHDHVYEDMASKFFEHFVAIVEAINEQYGMGLWNEEDGFYYDQIRTDQEACPMKILSMVGLVPLFSCLVLKESDMRKHPGFYRRTKWFLDHRKDLSDQISFMVRCNEYECHEALLLALVKKEQLIKVLKHMLDEKKFLSPYGIRSLSKHHKEEPFVLHMGDNSYSVRYEPGESESKLFGGNSNWRGPIWLPMNYLIIENLRRYDYFYGESLKVECPTGSGNYMRLNMVARELSSRLAKLFLPDLKGVRPCHGGNDRYAKDPNFKDLVLFYEYFHSDTGRGCGASHQTGWTALIATLLKYIHKSQMEMDALSDFSSEGEQDGK